MNPWRDKITGQGGYTFNELLAAMGIVVSVVLVYSLNSATVFRQQVVNSNATIALQLAQDKLEELQARRRPADEDRCPSAGESGLTAAGSAGGIFDRCWRVQPSPLGTDLKQLDVTVSWRDHQAGTVTLSTLLFVGL